MIPILKNFQKHKKSLTLFIWALLALVTCIHHEIWRDEMRMLGTAIMHDSWLELTSDMVNEGHPILWYFVLKLGYFLYPHTVILKVIAFLIGLVSSGLILYYLRLPFIISTLFIFSNIMMFENTVMARDYGISALLIILFYIAFEKNRFGISILCIVLLIQTNLVGAIVALFLSAWIIYVSFIKKTIALKYIFLSILILGSSFLMFYLTTKTNELSYFYYTTKIEIPEFAKNLCISIAYPSKVLSPFIPDQPLVCALCIYFLTFVLSKKKFNALLFYGCAIVINLIFLQVYKLSSRHIGVLFVFFLILYVQNQDFIWSEFKNRFEKLRYYGNRFVVPILFFILVISNIVQCHEDIFKERSSSKAVSNFIKSSPKYAKSICMSEPDFYLEPLPYYIDNKMFYPRENRFAYYSSFSKLNKDSMGLNEIIAYSDDLKSNYQVPVLILFKYFNFKNPACKQHFIAYVTKTLSWNPEDLKRIKKLKVFDQAVGDENYTLYEIL